MQEPILVRQQRKLWRKFPDAETERLHAEAAAEADLRSSAENADTALDTARHEAEARRTAEQRDARVRLAAPRGEPAAAVEKLSGPVNSS